jgi:DNA-binding NtrC family response regulator
MTEIETRSAMERRHRQERVHSIHRALLAARGHPGDAARLLGWERNAMSELLRRYTGETALQWWDRNKTLAPRKHTQG